MTTATATLVAPAGGRVAVPVGTPLGWTTARVAGHPPGDLEGDRGVQRARGGSAWTSAALPRA
ncbi:MAG: hypothetical protein WC273_09585 [Dehalococcoidia bacterium]